MSFSFSSLIRLLVLLALSTTLLAVGLSRLDPPRPERRTRRTVSHMNINEYFLDVTDRSPRWLDVETGKVVASSLEDGGVLESATCSPWVDEKGHRHVVGRWSSRTKDGPMSMSNDFGLARYTFPGGKMVDQVSTEIVPVGPPCWFPGTGARILFAAGDGMLYHYSFEPEPSLTSVKSEVRPDAKPMPLTWRCDKPGEGAVYISDVSWPEDPRMGGCVVVSLRDQMISSEGSRRFSRTQLWWLRLNFAGTEIVECGRLLIPGDQDQSDGFDERSPAVGSLSDGRLVLAYLQQSGARTTWELRVTPIDFEGERRVPVAHASENFLLAERCQPAQPSFSADGRWINAITGPFLPESHITRYSTRGLLAGAK